MSSHWPKVTVRTVSSRTAIICSSYPGRIPVLDLSIFDISSEVAYDSVVMKSTWVLKATKLVLNHFRVQCYTPRAAAYCCSVPKLIAFLLRYATAEIRTLPFPRPSLLASWIDCRITVWLPYTGRATNWCETLGVVVVYCFTMVAGSVTSVALEPGVQAVQWTGAPELLGPPSSGATGNF